MSSQQSAASQLLAPNEIRDSLNHLSEKLNFLRGSL